MNLGIDLFNGAMMAVATYWFVSIQYLRKNLPGIRSLVSQRDNHSNQDQTLGTSNCLVMLEIDFSEEAPDVVVVSVVLVLHAVVV